MLASPLSSSKFAKNLQFNEKVTQLASTKSTPNISNETLKTSHHELDDDLGSVTSSEFDNSSHLSSILSPLSSRAKSSHELTPQPFRDASQDRESSNNSNTARQPAHLYKKKENSKSPVSFSSKHTADSDNDINSMDHYFEKERARQSSVRQAKKEPSPISVSQQALDKTKQDPVASLPPPLSTLRNGTVKNYVSEQNITTRTRATSSPAHAKNSFGQQPKQNDSDDYDLERDYLRKEKEKIETSPDNTAPTTSDSKAMQQKHIPFFSSLKRRAKSRASLSSLLHRAVGCFILLISRLTFTILSWNAQSNRF